MDIPKQSINDQPGLYLTAKQYFICYNSYLTYWEQICSGVSTLPASLHYQWYIDMLNHMRRMEFHWHESNREKLLQCVMIMCINKITIHMWIWGLTHCGLVTPYGDKEPDQHWLELWLGAWQHQAITWINIDQSSFHKKCIRYLSLIFVWKLLIHEYNRVPRDQ